MLGVISVPEFAPNSRFPNSARIRPRKSRPPAEITPLRLMIAQMRRA